MLDAPPRKIQATSLLQTNSNVATVNPSRKTTSAINKQSTLNKPVPIATVRSSKLAAMAANMKNNQDADIDLETDNYFEPDECTSKNDPLIKLENILIVPDINEDCNHEVEENTGYPMPSSVSSMSGNSTTHSSPSGAGENSLDVAEVGNGSFGSYDLRPNESTTISQENLVANASPADTRQQNMTLSCVNPSTGVQETNYRLESM